MQPLNNITDLTNFVLNNDLSNEELTKVLWLTLGVYYNGTIDKARLMQLIAQFVAVYPNIHGRPILVDEAYFNSDTFIDAVTKNTTLYSKNGT